MRTTSTSSSTLIRWWWHELLGSKRGVQLELCLAQLKTLTGQLRICGLCATIANLDKVLEVLLGQAEKIMVVADQTARPIKFATITPDPLTYFPWSGHLGLKVIDPLI